MRHGKHIHTAGDGRGPRDVFFNGKLVDRVMYADTRAGIVRVVGSPVKLDKWKKRVLTRTLRGTVEVRVKVGAGGTVHNVKWTAYSPSILGNSHLSWLALQSKRASLSGFEMGAAIYFRGWMAVKHGARPEYAALAPYSPGSCRLFWPTWRLRRCLSYG